MKSLPLAIDGIGLVTSVGASAAQNCAAFRAKLGNSTQTRFVDAAGNWIMGHQVELDQPWHGLSKLAKMAALAIEEAVQHLLRPDVQCLPLLLCIAEPDRPGRLEGLEDALLKKIQAEAGVQFAADSGVIPQGRVGVATAMLKARSLLSQGRHSRVLIVATDSLLSWPTLTRYEQGNRLLTELNSNGFMPGEGAGALLVQHARSMPGGLVCTGLGFGREKAHIDSGEPLRGDGLTEAVKMALADAHCAMHDFDYRITDISGEHYYFKEASLALSRTLRHRKDSFDLWHPAESTGEIGAASGTAMIALAQAACLKGYSPCDNILLHMANDGGQRAAMVLRYEGAA